VTWSPCYNWVMDYTREWMLKATAAGFRPFELIDPAPDESSLSGFGGSSPASLHIDFTYLIDGHEMAMGTAIGVPDDFDALDPRQTVLEVVELMLAKPFVFPLTLTARVDVRAIEVLVDGNPVVFKGIVAEGIDGWTVSARVDHDTVVTIQGNGDVVPVEIRRRNDLAIKGLLTEE
jgi:hypothetical protein